MRKRAFIIGGAAAAVAVIVAAGVFYVSVPQPAGEEAPALSSNRKFKLPEGPQTYLVTQAAEIWPKILEATIDPPDVHVGDVQRLEIVVEGPDAIASVDARIELDHETKILPLQLVGEVAAGDLTPSPYYIDENKRLAMRPSVMSVQAGVRKVGIANAASYPRVKYAAEWEVYDTHNEKYHTTFVVKDAKGRENSITLAWSDACLIPAGGDWNIASYGNCTISATDGVDGGNETIATYTLTLNAAFGFNAGQSISVTTGAIAIGSGGSIVQTNIWIQDSDGDNYYGSAQTLADADPGAAWIRRRDTGDTDCDDENNNIFQTKSVYLDADMDLRRAGSASSQCVGSLLTSLGCDPGVGGQHEAIVGWYQDADGGNDWLDVADTSASVDANDAVCN